MSSKKIQLIFVYFFFSFAVIILYNFNPAESSNIYPPSLTRELGGFYCAGCGTLRASHQLLHGNLQAAMRFNPLLILSIPYLTYWIAPYFLKYFYNIQPYTIKHQNIQIIATIIVVIIYTLLRNTSYSFLLWLVPPT